ncbi:MAG: prepilin-type N-terminal cleavage/methylation domain-containing protein [Clostridiales bacterium]|jgi:prepilin-type N-terminal cleavage/methylation domain-containing protein|nr:prepilin-type N-terminal cleavage/methylation domain-containing protein [Clostridiales bacterium]
MKKLRKGFSLVEVIVSVLILGIISGSLVVGISNHTKALADTKVVTAKVFETVTDTEERVVALHKEYEDYYEGLASGVPEAAPPIGELSVELFASDARMKSKVFFTPVLTDINENTGGANGGNTFGKGDYLPEYIGTVVARYTTAKSPYTPEITVITPKDDGGPGKETIEKGAETGVPKEIEVEVIVDKPEYVDHIEGQWYVSRPGFYVARTEEGFGANPVHPGDWPTDTDIEQMGGVWDETTDVSDPNTYEVIATYPTYNGFLTSGYRPMDVPEFPYDFTPITGEQATKILSTEVNNGRHLVYEASPVGKNGESGAAVHSEMIFQQALALPQATGDRIAFHMDVSLIQQNPYINENLPGAIELTRGNVPAFFGEHEDEHGPTPEGQLSILNTYNPHGGDLSTYKDDDNDAPIYFRSIKLAHFTGSRGIVLPEGFGLDNANSGVIYMAARLYEERGGPRLIVSNLQNLLAPYDDSDRADDSDSDYADWRERYEALFPDIGFDDQVYFLETDTYDGGYYITYREGQYSGVDIEAKFFDRAGNVTAHYYGVCGPEPWDSEYDEVTLGVDYDYPGLVVQGDSGKVTLIELHLDKLNQSGKNALFVNGYAIPRHAGHFQEYGDWTGDGSPYFTDLTQRGDGKEDKTVYFGGSPNLIEEKIGDMGDKFNTAGLDFAEILVLNGPLDSPSDRKAIRQYFNEKYLLNMPDEEVLPGARDERPAPFPTDIPTTYTVEYYVDYIQSFNNPTHVDVLDGFAGAEVALDYNKYRPDGYEVVWSFVQIPYKYLSAQPSEYVRYQIYYGKPVEYTVNYYRADDFYGTNKELFRTEVYQGYYDYYPEIDMSKYLTESGKSQWPWNWIQNLAPLTDDPAQNVYNVIYY